MNKTEKMLLDKAAVHKHRTVPVSYQQERAAAWLHSEGYGIWHKDASIPCFIIFPHVQRAWRKDREYVFFPDCPRCAASRENVTP